jgi:hypothetical protein
VNASHETTVGNIAQTGGDVIATDTDDLVVHLEG